MLQFDEENHVYTVDGQVKRYISQIMKDEGITSSFNGGDTYKRDIGRALHKACALDFLGILDPLTIDAAVFPYYRAVEDFFAASQFKQHANEISLYSKIYDYCGTLDDVGYLNGQFGLVEKKCTESIDPAIEIQMLLQQQLWDENYPDKPIQFRYGLQLRSNGTFALITKYSKVPLQVGLSAPYWHHWKGIHKR